MQTSLKLPISKNYTDPKAKFFSQLEDERKGGLGRGVIQKESLDQP